MPGRPARSPWPTTSPPRPRPPLAVGNTASADADDFAGPATGSDSVDILEDVDLSVTKSFSSDDVTAGGLAESFQIDVTNNGVSQADNITLDDLVDGDLIVGTITEGDFDCSASSGQTIDCSLATLDAGTTRSITVAYHVATTTEAAIAVGNTASADADDFAGPATGSDSVDILEDVDLERDQELRGRRSGHRRHRRPHVHHHRHQQRPVGSRQRSTLDDLVDGAPHRRRRSAATSTAPQQRQTIDCDLANLASLDSASITVTYSRRRQHGGCRLVANSASADADDFAGPATGGASVTIETRADVADLKTAALTVIAGNVADLHHHGHQQRAIGCPGRQPRRQPRSGPRPVRPGRSTPAREAAWTGHGHPRHHDPDQVHTIVITATVDPATPEGFEIEQRGQRRELDHRPEPGQQQLRDDDHGRDRGRPRHRQDRRRPRPPPVIRPASTSPSRVDNDGPSDNTGGFTVSDTLASGLTYVDAVSDPRCDALGQVVTCVNTAGLTASAAADTFVIHVTLTQTAEAGTFVLNTATVASDWHDRSERRPTTPATRPARPSKRTSTSSVTKSVQPRRRSPPAARRELPDRRHQQRRQPRRQHHPRRPRRRRPDRRPRSRRATSTAPPAAARRSTATLGHLDAGTTRSITVAYHVATTTEAATGRRQHGRRPTPTTSPARPRAPTASTSSRTSTSSVTKSFAGGPRRSPRAAPPTASPSRSPTTASARPTTSASMTWSTATSIVDAITEGDFDCSASSGQTIDCDARRPRCRDDQLDHRDLLGRRHDRGRHRVDNTAVATDADDNAGPATGSDSVDIIEVVDLERGQGASRVRSPTTVTAAAPATASPIDGHQQRPVEHADDGRARRPGRRATSRSTAVTITAGDLRCTCQQRPSDCDGSAIVDPRCQVDPLDHRDLPRSPPTIEPARPSTTRADATDADDFAGRPRARQRRHHRGRRPRA